MKEIITVGPTSGASGSATAEAFSRLVIRGKIQRICVEKVSGTPHANTDILVSTVEDDASLAETILAVADNVFASPAWYHPAVVLSKAADGTALTAYAAPFVENKIRVSIDQSNADVILKFTIYIEE